MKKLIITSTLFTVGLFFTANAQSNDYSDDNFIGNTVYGIIDAFDNAASEVNDAYPNVVSGAINDYAVPQAKDWLNENGIKED